MPSSSFLIHFQSRIAKLALVAATVASLAGCSLVAGVAQAATGATLSLTPATGSFAVGQSVAVSIYADTGGAPINAVEADVSYPQSMLQFESLDTTTSAFSISAVGVGTGGQVTIARGNIQPVTGRALVAVINFKVLSAGSASLQFLSTSALVTSTDNTNVLDASNGAVFTLTKTLHQRHFQSHHLRSYF